MQTLRKPERLLLLCLFFPVLLFSQTVIYVDSSASGLNNGQSWQNAYVNLDSALTLARKLGSVDSIKIARGTYRPSLFPDSSSTADPRDVSFHVAFSGIVTGGYASGGGVRNSKLYPTVLSGNIGIPSAFTDNAYHVLVIKNANVELSGLSVSDGYADGADSLSAGSKKLARWNGGGLYVTNSYMRLTELVAERNYAVLGGAVYNNAINLSLTNAVFTGNKAFRGGALYNSTSSTSLVTNTIAYRNSAEDAGGVLVNDNAKEYIIDHCTFVENGVNGVRGGAVFNRKNNGSSKITNTLFSKNFVLGDSTLTQFAGADVADSSNAASLSYNLLQAPFAGQNNYPVADAQLVNVLNPKGGDNLWATADDGLAISLQSQAFKNGGGTSYRAYDITGAQRSLTVPFDIGAYEIDPCPQFSGRVAYVDSTAGSGGNGSSWSNAFTSLQAALNAAQRGCVDTIKIAAGTYRPSNFLRNASGNFQAQGFVFQLPSNLVLWGGYGAGGAGTPDPSANKTVLSGTARVVFAGDVSNVVLNGLVIQNGVSSGSPTDAFTVNGKSYLSAQGGGLLAGNAGINIKRCSFRNNRSTNNGGGAAFVNSTVKMDSCTFEGNTTPWQGGGLYVNSPAAGSVIDHTIFQNNSANYFGGGIFLSGGTAVAISNSRFTKNKTVYTGGNTIGGGAIFSDQSNTVVVTKCTFDSNAGDFGGAIRFDNNASGKIINSFFLSNSSARNGGAVYNASASVNFYNCIFYGNSAAVNGGGLASPSGPANVYFSDFIRNNAGGTGGGVYGSANVANSLFWRNKVAGDSTAAAADISGASVTGSSLQTTPAGGDNFSGVDPRFVNPNDLAGSDGMLGTGDDGLRLTLQSPLINEGKAGFDSVLLTTDLSGLPRRLSSYPDMGAYEVDFCGLSGFTNRTVYVDSSATSGDKTGRDWANAFVNLESALRALRSGCNTDTVKMARGTYYPSAAPGASPYSAIGNKSDYTFSLPGNTVVLGGYPSGGGVRNFSANPTILSGYSRSPLFLSHHVILIKNKTNVTVDGCRIEDGFANEDLQYHWFEDEYLEPGLGGALYISNSTVNIKNCLIQNNRTAIYTKNSKGRFFNCAIVNNSSPDPSAGVNSYSSPLEYVNCVFAKDSTYGLAGGAAWIATPDGLPSFKNCTFYKNTASLGGAIGAGYIPYITNCLFWNNKATSYLPQSRLSENEISIAYLKDSSRIAYSLFQYKPEQYSGVHCIYGLNPALADSANGPGADNVWGTPDDGFRLTAASVAVNHGLNDSVPPGVVTDFAGTPRIFGGTVDVGAYEAIAASCSNFLFVSNLAGDAYQWQVNAGNGFADINDNATFTGTNTAMLNVNPPSTTWSGYTYRCRVKKGLATAFSDVLTLLFSALWTGNVSSAWSNPGNWHCNRLPDGATDIYILAGSQNSVYLDMNASCRTITIQPGASFTVGSGYTLTINK